MKYIKRTITKISGHRGYEGYYTLCCAVSAAMKYQPKEPLMKEICADIHIWTGKEYGTIERSLCRATNDIWEFGNRAELNNIYGRTIENKPNPKELIYVIAEYVWSISDEVDKYQIRV